jgi:ABC-type multidrug transport system fused ATPase/permease subunit
MNEATSEVDVESEQFIRAALEQLFRDRTTFYHRPPSCHRRKCRPEVVLDKGEIVDQGTHRKLFERCSLYRDLCETQFLNNLSRKRRRASQRRKPRHKEQTVRMSAQA